MNYDTIIVEMLSRIQKLEEQVKLLTDARESAGTGNLVTAGEKKVTTADIRSYIEGLKCVAGDSGDQFLVIKANDIHKAMGLKSRFPMVCNAMRQAMGARDVILHETASGHSSTFEVKYDLSDWREDG